MHKYKQLFGRPDKKKYTSLSAFSFRSLRVLQSISSGRNIILLAFLSVGKAFLVTPIRRYLGGLKIAWLPQKNTLVNTSEHAVTSSFGLCGIH